MTREHKNAAPLPDPRETPTMRIPAVARALDVSRDTAYQAARNGELPVIRVRGALRVPTAALWQMLGLTEEATLADEGLEDEVAGITEEVDDSE